MIKTKAIKPTSGRAYGSIAHLPGSHITTGDHYAPDGYAKILTEKVRDRHDIIVVQEKLDGSCVAIARQGDTLHAIQRKGYPCLSSPHAQHHMFARWADANRDRFMALLGDGERVVGEWLALAHGTKYRFELDDEPFAAFDIFTPENERILTEDVCWRCADVGINVPRLLSHGNCALQPAGLLRYAESRFNVFKPEGLVYRCERKGRVLFLAKYVRPGYVPGYYLNDDEPVWNWREKE